MMMNLIKRFFKRVFKSLFGLYAPSLLTCAFAFIWIHFFPDGPLWPVPVFLIFIIYIFVHHLKC